MANDLITAALPVGEFRDEPTREAFAAILHTISNLVAGIEIADPITDDDQARKSVQEFSRRNPDLLLIIPLRGLSAPVIETAIKASRAPCLVWPIPGTFALPSSALAIGAAREEGAPPVELLYAPPDHPASIERARVILHTAKAYSRLARSRIGVIGGLFPNLVSCRFDPEIIRSRTGAAILPIPFNEVRDVLSSPALQGRNLEEAVGKTAGSYRIDPADENALRSGLQLHLALKQIAEAHQIDGFATECWSGFPRELGLNPCLGFLEDTYSLACEGDVMLCISLLIVRHLTGASAFVGDLYDLDLDGNLTLVHCGAPASLASDAREVILSKSPLAMERGFDTITCRPGIPPGPVTIFRLYGLECNQLHLAAGDLQDTDRTRDLTVKVKLSGNRWDFLAHCFGNHYLVVPGDIREELKLLGKWLGITLYET
jgi:L-fucose isomerase-like protein